MQKKVLFLILIFYVLAIYNVHAAPAINSASGYVQNGSLITITGSAFGSKSPAAPVAYLTFDNGSSGSTISESGWVPTADGGDANKPKYTNQKYYGASGKSVRFNPNNPTEAKSALYYDFSSAPRQIYITYNTYKHRGANSYRSKWLRLQGDGGTPEFVYQPYAGDDVFVLFDANGSNKFDSVVYGMKSATEKWARDEFWIDQGTQNGNNAYYKGWRHNIGSSISYKKGGPDNWLVNSERIYNVFLGSEFEQNLWQYMDNVYLDTTQARVELGNASTWNESTHREIQIPSSWSNSSININLNQGSFANGNTVYLYVVDSNGNVNSNGYPVTIGSSGNNPPKPPPPDDNNPPNPPTGLQIVAN